MSMTDRELLELAAKAAGVDGEYHREHIAHGDQWIDGIYTGARFWWNPVVDDGQALRLAIKLGICIQFIPECDAVQVYQEREFTAEPFNVHVGALGDIETRRCIVHAAAEIGKTMQESKA